MEEKELWEKFINLEDQVKELTRLVALWEYQNPPSPTQTL